MTLQTHVILGAGQAGAHAAMAMREAGFAGRIVLVGEEPARPYERPPLSKEMLTGDAPPQFFHPEARYGERDITLMLGARAEAIDADAGVVRLADGTSLGYDALLLATGGRARRLDVPGGEAILYLRTLDDARALRARLLGGGRVVCVGAGVIGLEIASSARALGCDVTVIEAGPGVMGRSLTPDFAAHIAALHRANGVELRLGTGIAAIEGGEVVCADGTRIPADLVVAGVGMRRNTELAEAAGVAVENGILVDELGRTSLPGIFAAGDVAAFLHPRLGRLRQESWRHAQNHGIAVGRAMAGGDAPYDDVPWFWTDQHGTNLQQAGLADPALRAVMRGERGGASFAAFHLDGENRVVSATGINAPREIRAAMALIQSGRQVDPVALADPAANLQRIAVGR